MSINVLPRRVCPTGCDVGKHRDPEIDGPMGTVLLCTELGKFVLGASEADLESFDFAEPSFAFGLGIPAITAPAAVPHQLRPEERT